MSVALLRVLRFRLILLWAASFSTSVLILGDECVHVELAGCAGSQTPLFAIGDCAGNAVRPVSDASLDELLAAIERLEILPDARELMSAFTG